MSPVLDGAFALKFQVHSLAVFLVIAPLSPECPGNSAGQKAFPPDWAGSPVMPFPKQEGCNHNDCNVRMVPSVCMTFAKKRSRSLQRSLQSNIRQSEPIEGGKQGRGKGLTSRSIIIVCETWNYL